MSIRSRRIAAIAIVFVVGCGGSECKVENVEYTKSVTAVGTGATLGLNVARFDLAQNFVTHTPYEACAQGPLQDTGVVTLSITSLASQPIFLKYDVQGLNTTGVPMWSHQDSVGVTIAPNQTVAIGDISTSTQKLGDGGARVLIQVAQYVP